MDELNPTPPTFPTQTVTTNSGKRLEAFVGDEITEQITLRGEYDGLALQSLREVLGRLRPRTSLDVGANIGNHAVVIGEQSARVVAFEPIPAVFALLDRNLQHNLGPRGQAFNLALSDCQAELAISVASSGNLGSSSLESVSGEQFTQTIQAVLGDDFLAKNDIVDIDFIKIDVEGHEGKALLGLQRTIARDQPLIILEWRHPKTITDFRQQNLFDVLLPGYQALALVDLASKKLYPRTLLGRLQRLHRRLRKPQWCLSDFRPERKFSNVYLVPARHLELFRSFPHRPLVN
jgi:FkbM family methyltransferase